MNTILELFVDNDSAVWWAGESKTPGLHTGAIKNAVFLSTSVILKYRTFLVDAIGYQVRYTTNESGSPRTKLKRIAASSTFERFCDIVLRQQEFDGPAVCYNVYDFLEDLEDSPHDALKVLYDWKFRFSSWNDDDEILVTFDALRAIIMDVEGHTDWLDEEWHQSVKKRLRPEVIDVLARLYSTSQLMKELDEDERND